MTQLVSFTDADSGEEIFVSPLQVVALHTGAPGHTAISLVDQEEPTTVIGQIGAVAAAINGAF